MSKIKRKRRVSYRFSEKQRASLKEVSDAKAEALALADPDNPPLTEQQLSRMSLAREVRLVREKTGLSQPQFAARFHIGLARLRDFEQARSEPDFIVRVFLRMILQDPDGADGLVKLVERESTAHVPSITAEVPTERGSARTFERSGRMFAESGPGKARHHK